MVTPVFSPPPPSITNRRREYTPIICRRERADPCPCHCIFPSGGNSVYFPLLLPKPLFFFSFSVVERFTSPTIEATAAFFSLPGLFPGRKLFGFSLPLAAKVRRFFFSLFRSRYCGYGITLFGRFKVTATVVFFFPTLRSSKRRPFSLFQSGDDGYSFLDIFFSPSRYMHPPPPTAKGGTRADRPEAPLPFDFSREGSSLSAKGHFFSFLLSPFFPTSGYGEHFPLITRRGPAAVLFFASRRFHPDR